MSSAGIDSKRIEDDTCLSIEDDSRQARSRKFWLSSVQCLLLWRPRVKESGEMFSEISNFSSLKEDHSLND